MGAGRRSSRLAVSPAAEGWPHALLLHLLALLLLGQFGHVGRVTLPQLAEPAPMLVELVSSVPAMPAPENQRQTPVADPVVSADAVPVADAILVAPPPGRKPVPVISAAAVEPRAAVASRAAVRHVPAVASTSAPVPTLDPAYIQALLARLQAATRYPEAARRRRLQGQALVRLELAGDGRLLRWQLLQGTGQPLLDAAIGGILRRAAPFPPVPVGWSAARQGSEAALALNLPVRFSLTRN